MNQVKYNIKIIRSKRKSISIEVKPDFNLLVRAPLKMRDNEIMHFIDEKSNWINKHMQKMAVRPKPTEITKDELHELAEQAVKLIPERVRYYAPLVGVQYGRITIRNQKTRWGSCSSKGNLNFNCLLMNMPSEIIDYVVVHELCHRLEMNHSKQFWAEVERVYPTYKQARAWLEEHGTVINHKLPAPNTIG